MGRFAVAELTVTISGQPHAYKKVIEYSLCIRLPHPTPCFIGYPNTLLLGHSIARQPQIVHYPSDLCVIDHTYLT